MENPRRAGYISLIRKIRFGGKEPININLLDFSIEIDDDIRFVNRKILRKLGMDKLPNGIKK